MAMRGADMMDGRMTIGAMGTGLIVGTLRSTGNMTQNIL